MKPKYNLFSNTKFALDGVFFMLKSEAAFRIEIAIIAPLAVISLFLPVEFYLHLLLISVMVLVLIVECVNSAIESCVDLVTKDFYALAKIAKDCASAAVFFSVCLAIFVWCAVLFELFF